MFIQTYTSRVVAIKCHRHCHKWTTSVAQLQSVAFHSPPPVESLPPLFPKLTAILDEKLTPDDVWLFYWLNGPFMTKFKFHIATHCPGSQALKDYISNMGILYPNMKTFFLNINQFKPHTDRMMQSLSKAIGDWKHLERVGLNAQDLDTAAYEHLMRLESLSSLTLVLDYKGTERLVRAVLPQKHFPALRNLTLIAFHISRVVSWLHCLHLCPSSLSCIALKRSSLSSPDLQSIADLCHTIATQLCLKSLERIELASKVYSTRVSVPVDAVRPLFSFSRLRCVKIARLCTAALSDGDLLELATSWPLLQVLELGNYVETRNPVVIVPTLQGFFHLLRHCAHLEQLVIVVDLRESEVVDTTRHTDGIDKHPLHHLCLGNSLIDDAKSVASILSALLPALERVGTSCWKDARLSDLPEKEALLTVWNRVNAYLGELRMAR